MQKIFGILAALTLLVACHSNPYQGTQGVVLRQTPGDGNQLQGYSIDSQLQVNIIEGTSLPIKIVGHVPQGTPQFAFDTLPSWATFDPVGQNLNCSPPVGAATNTFDPTANYMTYSINLTMTSNMGANVQVQRAILIVVHSATSNMRVTNFNQSAQVTVGGQVNFTFTIESARFPTGPFRVSAANTPAGLTITGNPDATRYTVNFAPPVGFVTQQNADARPVEVGRLDRTISWQMTVIDPDNKAINIVAHWIVMDLPPVPGAPAPQPPPQSSPQTIGVPR